MPQAVLTGAARREELAQRAVSAFNTRLRLARQQRTPYLDSVTHVWHAPRLSRAYYAGGPRAHRAPATGPAPPAPAAPVSVVVTAAAPATPRVTRQRQTERSTSAAVLMVSSPTVAMPAAPLHVQHLPTHGHGHGHGHTDMRNTYASMPAPPPAPVQHAVSYEGEIKVSPSLPTADSDLQLSLSQDVDSLLNLSMLDGPFPTPPSPTTSNASSVLSAPTPASQQAAPAHARAPVAPPAQAAPPVTPPETPQTLKRPSAVSSLRVTAPAKRARKKAADDDGDYDGDEDVGEDGVSDDGKPGDGNVQVDSCANCSGPALGEYKRGLVLVACRVCRKPYHPDCLNWTPAMLDHIDRRAWECIDCKNCCVCRAKVDEDKMLFCDHCDHAYHMYCLTPPLSGIPADEWLCPPCQQRAARDRR